MAIKAKKIDPALMRVVQDFEEAGTGGLEGHAAMLGVARADAASPQQPSAVVFLHCSPTADFSNLAAAGIVINEPRGRIRTGIVPLDKVEVLAEDSNVQRIIASRKLRPLLDVAAKKVHLPAFRTSSRLSGDGVVVGIVDSGIDATHPDFAGRIHSIWDQGIRHAPGVAEGQYGLELKGADLPNSRDRDGHGTHVAGIAAGAGPEYTGVAPKATLVIVKTDFDDAHIANGIQYVFRVAQRLGLPAVVNLSLGGHSDAHDGTDSLSLKIDELSGPGRIVCCAAGNEGNDNIHALVALGPKRKDVRFHVPQRSVTTAELNGWYPGTGKIEIAVRRPGPGGRVTPFQPVISPDQFTHIYELGNARITVQTPGRDRQNSDHNFRVVIRNIDRTLSVPSGVWRLMIRNSDGFRGPLHIWSLDDADYPEVLFTGKSIADSHKIGSPGCSREAVTVASYTSRIEWPHGNGVVRVDPTTLNKVSDFSSEGPLRDGSKKPDVTAPGDVIASCLSRDSTPEDVKDRIDDKYVVEGGTSMASPFISGIVALLLERDRTLDPAGIKRRLKRHSAIPRSAAGRFHPKWGFGLINAKNL